jgi:hypothetical protein
MKKHDQIYLYLDKDKAGSQRTQQALKWSTKFVDKSHLYKHSKDLNEYLIKQQQGEELKRSHRFRMKF